MNAYPAVWVRGWLLCATAGVCLAMLIWSPVVAMVTTAVAVAVAGLALVWAQHRCPDRIVLGRYGSPRRELVAASGLGLVGLRALGDVSSAAVFWVLLALSLSHPGVVGALRRLVPAAPVRPGQVEEQSQVPEPVTSLTIPELCEAWRDSCRLLAVARSAQEVQRAVALRQSYLDEMGRRDPAGLSAWLESGARPSGGALERYLRDRTVSEGE